MEKTLYELFKMGQEGDEKAKLELYKIFLPRIRKFGRKLFYEEAETDLTIFLLEFIDKANLEKFQNRKDEEIDSYMYRVSLLNVSRQTIYKQKKKALIILKDEIKKGGTDYGRTAV